MDIKGAIAFVKAHGGNPTAVFACLREAMDRIPDENLVRLINAYIKKKGESDFIMSREEFRNLANGEDFLNFYDRIVHDEFDPACDWFRYDDYYPGYVSLDSSELSALDTIHFVCKDIYTTGEINDTDLAIEFDKQFQSLAEDM